MRDIAQLRRRFIALAVLLALIALAAAVFLLTPYGRSRERLQQEYQQLRVERQRKELEDGPLANIDQRLVVARQQIAEFYRDRLPDQYSAVSAELARLASQSGVKLGQVKYDVEKDLAAPGVRALHVSAKVTGDYKDIVRFINALERDKMLFEPTSVDLSESQQGISLELKLDTYLQEGAA